MKTTRINFLRRLFQLLDQRNVVYCVNRNYRDLYEVTDGDVDMLALPESVGLILEISRKVAKENGFLLVQKTRFVNHSFVFWHPISGFVRLDIETETRWRIFPVLAAGEILGLRQKYSDFYIPAPEHEAVVLLTQTAWMNSLTPRYSSRLEELRREIAPQKFSETIHRAFSLKAIPSDAAELPHALRMGLIKKSVLDSTSLVRMIRHFSNDLLRVCRRLRNPPGIFLRMRSRNVEDVADLLRNLEFLFPGKAVVFEKQNVSMLQLFRILWKGGLAVEMQIFPTDELARKSAERAARTFFPRRTFVCAKHHDGSATLAHLFSGAMMSLPPTEPWSQATEFFVQCMAKQIERNAFEPGRFVVLLGLDGSGKTTLARNLTQLALEDSRVQGVRYFHWLPSVVGKVELPWKSFLETPRKKKLAPSALHSAISLARLTKNILRANLAYWFCVRPLLARGFIVLVDRYFYNYWLDPQSVRYVGPQHWLERLLRLFPKPDLIIRLQADSETLLLRKRELSAEEIFDQNKKLQKLPSYSARVLDLDATEEPFGLSQKAFAAICERNTPEWVAFFQLGTGEETISVAFTPVQKAKREFLFLPCSRTLAAQGLELYSAQTFKARLAKKVLANLFFLRWPLKTLYLDFCLTNPFAVFLRRAAGLQSGLPLFAVLCGNPNNEGRRFVFLIFDENDNPVSVVKAGSSPAAQNLIQRELTFLQSLPEDFGNIPRPLASLETGPVAAFAESFVAGRSPGAASDDEIFQVLSTWLHKSRVVPISELAAWERLEATVAKADFARLASVGAKTVRPTIYHGDFAPWNIKVSPDSGEWTVLDWERGELEGIPGWDWFHFRIQNAVLVEKFSATRIVTEIQRLLASAIFQRYADEAGIGSIKKEVLTAYLFHVTEVEKPAEGIQVLRQVREIFSRL